MLFNSLTFLFVFLPLTVLGYFAVWKFSSHWSGKLFLVLASLVFYCWWNPLNFFVIAVSVALNFSLGQILIRKISIPQSLPTPSILIVGIIFNIGLLGYFKYLNFTVEIFNFAFGTQISFGEILLPLGISFFTFQQIAFLIDANAGQIKAPKFLDYVLFVTFFPQLISGPIVHYREMMPQFERPFFRGFSDEGFSVGLTLLIIGLFKKIVLADIMKFYSDLTFDAASNGHPIQFLEAWAGSTAFSLQLYFDFSGYSDMAVGLGRMLGVCIPLNFNSPYKARSVIEFWTRWHITLSRFFNAYVYNPVILGLTRSRAYSSVAGLGAQNKSLGAFGYLIAFPTMITMFLIGIWHGASYTFALLGLFHGFALLINHSWRIFRKKVTYLGSFKGYTWQLFSLILTFLTVTSSFVLFRADNLLAAKSMYEGMLGLNGIAITPLIMGIFEFFDLDYSGLTRSLADYQFFWTAFLLLVVFFAPNSQQILFDYLNPSRQDEKKQNIIHKFYDLQPYRLRYFSWKPNLAWGVCFGVMAYIAIFSFSGTLPTAFLYFEF